MTPPDPVSANALLADCDWLARLARRLVSDAHLAEDAVQDTLAAALVRARTDGPPGRGWLARVLENAIRQVRRRDARRQDRESALDPPGSAPSTQEVAERLAVQRTVVEAVHGLDEPYRTALVLRYFDDLPASEVARRLDVPVKTARTRIDRAIQKLRARLDSRLGGEGRTWLSALLPLVKTSGFQAATGAALVSTQLKVAAAVVTVALGAWTVTSLTPDASHAAPDPALEPASTDAVLVATSDPEVVPEQPEPAERQLAPTDEPAQTLPESSAPAEARPNGSTSAALPVFEPVSPAFADLPGFPPEDSKAWGRVVDENGEPVDGEVAVVGSGGSYSMTTDRSEGMKGTFSFNQLWRSDGEFAVKATTKDGRIAVRGGLRVDDLGGLELMVLKGATLNLLLEGDRDRCRCALISNAVWFEDFTIRKDKPRAEVVPPGPLLIELYEGTGANRVVFESRTVNLAPEGQGDASFYLLK